MYVEELLDGSWASGGALNTSKGSMSHAGTATAGLVFGGGTQIFLFLTVSPIDCPNIFVKFF